MKNQNSDLKLSQAITGYLLNCSGKHLSHNSIADYTNTLKKFLNHFDQDILIKDITSDDISAFFANETVSKKTISNYYTTLGALWSYLQKKHLITDNPVKILDRPKPERRVIDPIPLDQIKNLMKATKYSKTKSNPGKKSYKIKLGSAHRNKAILLFLLDNGVRASELCSIQMKDMDFSNRRAFVFGKGAAERFIPFSERTAEAIWLYHNNRKHLEPDDYVFTTERETQLNRYALLNIIVDIGERAGITDINVHKFRHTFAITYIRAGGDPYTLQAILGHSTLDMVKRYLQIAKTDISLGHRRASPVEYLRL